MDLQGDRNGPQPNLIIIIFSHKKLAQATKYERENLIT